MNLLDGIHAEIEARVNEIRIARADWPCAKGCDRCCRGLAAVPQLRAAEWDLLRAGLQTLAPDRLEAIGVALAALARDSTRPVVCPLLDRVSGACQVYPQRPAACRTYGFYVQRDKGLYCGEIEHQVAAGKMDGVVWGNHDVIERRLAALGEARPLSEWFAAWDRRGSA